VCSSQIHFLFLTSHFFISVSQTMSSFMSLLAIATLCLVSTVPVAQGHSTQTDHTIELTVAEMKDLPSAYKQIQQALHAANPGHASVEHYGEGHLKVKFQGTLELQRNVTTELELSAAASGTFNFTHPKFPGFWRCECLCCTSSNTCNPTFPWINPCGSTKFPCSSPQTDAFCTSICPVIFAGICPYPGQTGVCNGHYQPPT
jgi:hypothetical protein